MKRFKEFKSEQQYVAEVGPIGAAMMGAMGLFGAWKAFKGVKEKIKGWKETKADKKARAQDGYSMSVKVYNPATDKEELQDFYVDPKKGNPDLEKLGYKIPKTLTGKIKAPSDDDLDKMEKEANRKSKRANAGIKRKIKSGNYDPDDLTTDQQTQLADKGTKDVEDKETKDKEAEDKAAREKRAGIEDVGDAEKYFANNRSAPDGWEDVRTDNERDKEHDDYIDFKGKILTNKDAEAYRKKKERLADKRSAEKKAADDKEDQEIAKRKKERETKVKTDKDNDQKTSNNQSSKTTPKVKKKVTKSAAAHVNPKDLKKAGIQTTGRILSFG